MMASTAFAADAGLDHVNQASGEIWSDGLPEGTTFELSGLNDSAYLVWSVAAGSPDAVLSIGAEGKDIFLSGANRAADGVIFFGGQVGSSVDIVAKALKISADNTQASANLTGFRNIRSVKADSLTVDFGQTDAHAGGTYTLIKTTGSDRPSDINVKGDINVKTKGLKLFDLASGSTATLKSETGGITIEGGASTDSGDPVNAGSTLNLEAERDIVIHTTADRENFSRLSHLGTAGTLNLTSRQGDIEIRLDGVLADSTTSARVLTVQEGGSAFLKAKNIRLIGGTEGGQFLTGVLTTAGAGELKIVADEEVWVQVHSGGARSPNGIELYGGKTFIEAQKFFVDVEHTAVGDSDQPSGILLPSTTSTLPVELVINADADVHVKRSSENFTDDTYGAALAFGRVTQAARVNFQKNATLTSDYAIKAGNPATDAGYLATIIKSGTGDLNLNGRVYLPHADSLLDVQDNCGVILNGTDDTFTDVIAKYSGAQGTRLVKNSVSDLKLGFANNTLAGDFEINTGKVILTTDAEFSGNVTVDGSALTANATEGVLSGTGTLSFAEGSKVVVKNVAATAENDFYTLTSGFSAVSGLDNIASNNRLQKVTLLEPTDDQYRFTVATLSASDAFGDDISNSELIDQISGSGSDTEIGQIIETIASQDPASVTNEEIAHQLDSVFDFSKLSGASYGALYAAGLASDAITEHVRSEKAARNTGLWVDVMGGHNRIKELGTSGHHYGLKTDAYGVTFGADMPVYEGLNLGAAMTFVKNDIESTGSYQKTENKQKTYGVRVYGKQSIGEKASLIGQIGYAYADNDITQGLPAGLGVLKGDPKGSVVSAEVGLELPLMTGSWEVVQHTGVKYNYVKTDGFTATRNGAAVYRAEKQENHVVQVPIGVRIGKTIEAQGWTVKPQADISIVPALGGNTLKTKIRVGDVSAMTTKTDLISETYAAGMIGVEAEKGPHAVGLKYRFAAGDSDMQDHSVRVQYRYSF